MEEKNERKQKSEILFNKAIECYSKQNYEEALKYFKSCIKFYPNERAELFIRVCENNIPSNNNNTNTNNTSYKKSYSSSFPNSHNSSNNSNNNKYSHQSSFSSQTSEEPKNSSNNNNSSDQSDDIKCKELLKKKDYYDLLNVSKDASTEDIKRGYKKQAVRFHPDKNHSKLAEECFKKISEAYQCLSDPEKKKFYDKYGNEEEFRQRYYQAHQNYYEEEMDPYDIFEILFGGGAIPRRGRGGRNRNHYYRHNFNNVQFNDFGAINLRGSSLLFLFIPFLLMILLQIIPSIITLLKPAPLYQFVKSNIYRYSKKTSRNNVEFFVNDKFLKKYPRKTSYSGIEKQIEKEYLNYLYDNCMEVLNRKQKLEYYMRYSYSYYERFAYKQEIEKLNYNYCEKYNGLKNRIK